MRIDPHVHCRDGKESYKGTIAHALKVATEQGLDKIYDMPNTNPPIIYKNDVLERLKLVPKGQEERYFLYMGATSDSDQLRGAVECHDELNEVVGIKMFAGRSVGSLAVIAEEEQKKVYETLVAAGYTGVLAVHCEKENCLKPELWGPVKPITHSYARPKEAEIESVKDQIKFAKEAKFKGSLHICHVSCPESVELIDDARRDGLYIRCGVTPHHILWSHLRLAEPDGLMYKMNPPLRGLVEFAGLREKLMLGAIDWVETDHAPHSRDEKLNSPYLSGYPSLHLYKDFVERVLPQLFIGKERIVDMTEHNIRNSFKRKG